MKKIVITLFISMAALVGFQAFADNAKSDDLPIPQKSKEEPINKIVAVVNKTIITQNDVNNATEATINQLQQRGIPIPNKATLRKKILDGLVYQKLQLQMAQQNNITVSKDQVTAAMENIAKRNNISVDELKKRIHQQGIALTTFKKQLRDQLIVSQIQQQAIASKVHITPAEVSQYKKSVQQQNATTDYRVMDYLIPLSSKPSQSQKQRALKKAQAVIKQLRNNEKVSVEDVQTNNMGWNTLTDLPDLFATYIVKMKDKGVSKPILAENGYHVLQLLGTKQHSHDVTDQQAQQLLFQKKSQKILKKWLEQLRSTSYVKIYDK
jgi:peptidyl-prolyl cis-trans isomerase SurA